MKKKIVYYMGMFILASAVLTGCSKQKSSNDNNDSTTNVSESGTTSNAGNTTMGTSIGVTQTEASKVEIDKEFTARDLEVGYESTTATNITFNGTSATITGDDVSDKAIVQKDNMITIKAEGTYVFSGTWSDGQIVIDVDDKDKVQLVFNGVSISNSTGAPIYVLNADKVFITLQEGTVNTLEDGSEYIQQDENTVDGVIFSKSDLTLNGDGTLNITGNYKHGIVSKDKLVFTGGNYVINAVKDAINSKEGVKIKDGTFTLSSSTGNGIQSKNGDDETQGYVYIAGGNIDVITAVEGIEGTAIVIEDGTINIKVSDDGLNSAVGSADTETTTTTTTGKGGMFGGGGEDPFSVDSNCYIEISGGTLTVDAAGDGIDSNGNVYISGGTIYVNGPTNSGNGAFDYNGIANITGGTVVIVGSTGMAQGFSDSSTQYSILHNLSSVQTAGTTVTVTDESGKEIISYQPTKEYQSVVISSPDLKQDGTYTLTAGTESESLTLTSVVTSNGSSGMGGFGGMGGKGKGGPGGSGSNQGSQPPELPDGTQMPEGGQFPDGTQMPEGGQTPNGGESSQRTNP